MLRFVAALANPNRSDHYEQVLRLSQRLQAQCTWHVLYRCNALTIWATQRLRAPWRPLAQRHVVVLGTLFDRTGDNDLATPLLTHPSSALSARIIETQGAALLQHCWGDYLFFSHDLARHITRIGKDPTGSLPCYLSRLGELMLAFSHVGDCPSLGLPRFSINRSWLRERVLTGGLDPSASPLNEVSTVLRGEWIEFTHTKHKITDRGFHWRPQDFITRSAAVEQPADAIRQLRTTIQACTHAWAQQHPAVLLRLSGGLDSSIMAACLRDAPATRSIAYTYFDRAAAIDERPWAQQVARSLNLAHHEHGLDADRLHLRDLERLHASVWPHATLSYLVRAPVERSLCNEHDATAIVTGLGGDSLFGGEAIALTASDYLCRHGFTPTFLRLIAQVAQVTQRSVASVIRRTMQYALLGGRLRDLHSALREGATLVHPAVVMDVAPTPGYPHPWFREKSRIDWTTIRRLGELLYAVSEDGRDVSIDTPSPAIVSPLYSQPVVELCLRIPQHVHFLNGRERGLARAAFATGLPAAIVDRTWKDRPAGFFERVVTRNQSYLRERLLEGLLIREHLLDRKAVERALTLTPSKHATLPGELLRHLDTELWAEHWIL